MTTEANPLQALNRAQQLSSIEPRTRDHPQYRNSAVVAWIVAAIFYFYQYVTRSSPSVMMPQLADALRLSTVDVAAIIGLFYYGYSPCSLLAGAGMDRVGPRKVMPIAAALAGFGALLFAMGHGGLVSVGRLLQGVGGAFAPVGAIYIASTYFPPSRAATLIGATQMFGMAGGAAGQFIVGPLISKGLAWNRFWLAMAIAGIAMAVLLLFLLPKSTPAARNSTSSLHELSVVFRNPQSILCGLIAGLLFIPTTIFDMVWGVQFLQQGHGFGYASAVLRSATVPFGWIVGCPLLGFISDKIGRRKPVIAGGATVLLTCLAWILFGSPSVFPIYSIGFLAGVASGAAMLPYTVIKEVNPPEVSGMATGVVNFLNFTFSALLGPVFGWILRYYASESDAMQLRHYQLAFAPLLAGVAIALGLVTFLNETGTISQGRLARDH